MERKLTDLLPERYLNSPEVGAAAGIIWVLGEVFRARALDWLAQLTIDTATWGVVHWEREYGVTPADNRHAGRPAQPGQGQAARAADRDGRHAGKPDGQLYQRAV